MSATTGLAARISASGPAVRAAVFAAGLVAVFGALFGVGQAVGPWDTAPEPARHMEMK